MEIQDLNQTCPFGHRSTNYFSKEGQAPDLKEAQVANRIINSVLGAFVRFLDTLPKERSPASVELYEEWGRKSVRVSETVPSSLASVFPVRLTRSAEVVIGEIRAANSPVMQTIMRLHDEILKEEESHMKTARRVMSLIKDNYIRIFCDDPFVEILTLQQPSAQEGVAISDELWHLAVSYQDLQERCDSIEEVRSINALVHSRPEMLAELLGIQLKLFRAIELFLETNPQYRGANISFSEVALWDEATGEMIPSTRFLKIILHNWGVYFLEKPNASLDVMLRHGIYRALEDEIYQQNIFIFRRPQDVMRLYGVVSKVCPARLAVGKMVMHYLSE